MPQSSSPPATGLLTGISNWLIWRPACVQLNWLNLTNPMMNCCKKCCTNCSLTGNCRLSPMLSIIWSFAWSVRLKLPARLLHNWMPKDWRKNARLPAIWLEKYWLELKRVSAINTLLNPVRAKLAKTIYFFVKPRYNINRISRLH